MYQSSFKAIAVHTSTQVMQNGQPHLWSHSPIYVMITFGLQINSAHNDVYSFYVLCSIMKR